MKSKNKKKYRKWYYLKNKEKINKHSLDYYYNNKKKIQDQMKQNYLKNRKKRLEYGKEYQKQNKNKIAKYLKDYMKRYKKIYNESHKIQIKEYRKNYRQTHKKRAREYQIKYQKEHKERIRNRRRPYMREYQRNKRKADIEFKILCNLRTRIWESLKRNCKSKSTIKLLGCSIDKLRKHLESKFIIGMSWSNYGKWHIDHIKPCASFDLSKPSQQRKCFHYTNLQPLWAKENLRKGKK